jgi:dihydroorotase
MISGEILLKAGRVIDPSQDLDAELDVRLVDGLVAEYGTDLTPGKDCQMLDCAGLVVCPGLIDMHVHLRDPGREDKETIYSGTRAAAAGGFTSILCKANTGLTVDSPETVNYIYSTNARRGMVNVFPIAAITVGLGGTQLSDLWTVAEAKAIAISDDGVPVSDPAMMRRALQLARDIGILVMAHCEDETLAAGYVTETLQSWEMGLAGSPPSSEVVSIARDLALAREVGGKLHIDHISCRASLQAVCDAKAAGADVSCETCPHYFSLSQQDLDSYSTRFKMNPPLRSADDVAAMVEGLADGSIDVISSDHAPHTAVEKDRFFAEAPFGIVGLETSLAVALTFLHQRAGLPLARIVSLMSCNPARRLNLAQKGSLRPGSDADVTVLDPRQQKQVDSGEFYSLGHASPYNGMTLKGWQVYTIVAGELVAANGRIITE